jgi:hypothetical protein
MTKAKLLLAVCALGVLLTGCGGGGRSGNGLSACVIADVSGSTGEARSAYTSDFNLLAKRVGTVGSGNICVVLTAGDPQAEAPVADVYVGPTATRSRIAAPESTSPKNKILLAVAKASKQFEAVLAEPVVGDPGSALIEAAVVAAHHLRPGDELLYLSDGIQNSPTTGNFLSVDLSTEARERLLARLKQEGLIPDLEGVRVSFPFLLYHPHGLRIPQEQEVDIRSFWEEWAGQAKATWSPEEP